MQDRSDDATLAGPKTLLVGASGQVGTQMLAALGERALPSTRSQREGWLRLDLGELAARQQVAKSLDTHELDAVYCVGGMTHVDGCESEPELAWKTNARGPGVLSAYAQERGLPFIFFSTEYVFDGSASDPGPYAEDSKTNPLSVYGKTKFEGEQRVLEANPAALVIRTTVVFGTDPRRKNFLYTLMGNLSAGMAMRVPEDQVSTPTYNRDLVGTAMELSRLGACGIWHVAGPECLGRLAFAELIARRLGLKAALLEGVATAELDQKAARPLHAGLSTEKLQRRYPQLRMRTPAEGLEDCAAELGEFLR